MVDQVWLDKQAQLSLARLMPRISGGLDSARRPDFARRLQQHFPRLFGLLYGLYGTQYDFFYHLEQILHTMARMYAERPPALMALDKTREAEPLWFLSQEMAGGVCYVDRFAGDLNGIRARVPYFKELGLTYLHLMPLFLAPEENNDGGYAVSSYREVNPALGTMAQLRELAAELRAEGISLVLDFVFNHTSNEHEWAKRALAGDERYQAFYYMCDDRYWPDQYEQHLREIFPEQDPGSFTFLPEINKWVWTTFRHFQWDLNYANPEVFSAMMEEMLFLANQGVEVLRLDAVAFIWKQLGTSCENLPQAHQIIQAFNAVARIVAPALYFKSEAIVHPDFVAQYIDWNECQISYNPTLMNLLWEALATREVRLLRHSMEKRFSIPANCTWVNYVRCHDDIGWSFADEDASELGINGFDHRQFLNAFYTGRFPGSFARGLPFNYNPRTQDMRISGMCASLAGLEQALELDNPLYIEHALRRILLIHSIIISIGGIPLIYLGDELAMLNDYSYEQNPAIANDSRWVHRPRFDEARARLRHVPGTIPGRVFETLQQLLNVRRSIPAFADGQTRFFDTGNLHVLGYTRHDRVLVLANFSEHSQQVSRHAVAGFLGGAEALRDLVTGKARSWGDVLSLEPYEFLWLVAD
ncbi:MAG: alpha-amylase family glycosyl hydrolase [Anaerolineae bacterium]